MSSQPSPLEAIFGLQMPASSVSAPPPSSRTFKQRADAMLARGIPIIPLLPKSKDPCTKHAAYDATTDPAIIERWIDEYTSSSNCGAVACFDDFWMLDDDLGTLAEKYKADTGQDLPSTFTVKTSRGFHYYFRHDDASRLIRYDGHDNCAIEIPGYKGEARCNHQYVVAPGSVHPSGAIYEVYNNAPIVAAPVQLLEWLQKAYALSESIKSESKKPKSNRKADPGFNKLFDAVGYRPLLSRINALADAQLHITEGLRRGKTFPCPMPQHKHGDYTDCFGALQDVPELLHCLGKCGWTGDMVAACYELDGGKKKYANMYDCARAICKEEKLNSEDFFPVKPAAAETFVESCTSPAAQDASANVQNFVERPDMSRAVLSGRLGEICDKNMLNDFPVAYAWPSLVTAASVIVPERDCDHLHNLYTALVGPVNCGKSQAIEWAMKSLRIPDDPRQYSEVKPGSAERLLKYMNRLSSDNQLGPRVLMFLDEWKFFFDKASIENSVFPTLLTTGFYRRNATILDGHGHPLNVPAAFSWIGGIVSDAYEDCFSRAASLGLHDRFLHGVNPSDYAGFSYRPFDGEILPEGFEPTPVEIDRTGWECLKAWKGTNPQATREAELALRVAYICASFDGAPVLYGKDLGPHWVLAAEQMKIRETLKPNIGETPDAQCAIKVENYLKAYGPAGQWLDFRAMMKAIHYERFGPNVFERTVRGLVNLKIAEVSERDPAMGNHPGGRPAKVIRLVLE